MGTMRRILILTQKVDRNDDVLGFMHGWIAEFAKQCPRVTVVCLEKGECHFPANVKVLSLGKEEGRSKLKYVSRFFLYIWHERKNYDAVFVHMNSEYVLLGGLLWRAWGKKIGLWYAHGKTSLLLWLAEQLSDIVFTSTPEGFRLKSKKVHVVGQGIDIEEFHSRKPRVPKNGEAFSIVSVGRISPSKDYDTLIDATEILMQQHEKVRVSVIGGAGMPRQKDYFDYLKKKVREKGLGRIISFLGPIPHKDVPGHLAQADVFVNMGHTGSLDKAVLEAMASGLPVLTCNEAFSGVLGAHRDLLMYPKRDASALAQNIKRIARLGSKERQAVTSDLRAIIECSHSKKDLIKKIVEGLFGGEPVAVAEHYNERARGKYGGNYEHHRWFATPVLKAGYDMTKAAIERYALKEKRISFKDCLELGPGPGTWTKVFLESHPRARFDCVDISKEMLALSQKALGAFKGVRFFESDFMDFYPGKQYDFFFSSRALEYLPDKEALFAKVASMLKQDGVGFIITKTPKYLRSSLIGRNIASLHRGQISPRAVKTILVRLGFRHIACYPVTMYIPIVKSAALNALWYRIWGGRRLNVISEFFSESYCVIFSKDDN
ncbi:glycosyltransferase [Candidatus Azambacteria bacterium]|nr:glycosyltransferase [Candidatus Azambacteria bacterium]